jgi:tetratricopeptide (TPR) repeat protein
MTRRPALLIALVAAALFGPRLDHQFVTDDAIYIVENPAVAQGAPLGRYFLDRATVASDPDFHWQSYRPLRTLAFRAVAAVAGMRPLAFGLVNLALYVASAVLMLVLGRRLGLPAGPMLVATLLWVAAPVHAEPVLYASALGDHLSLLLELLALLLALEVLAADRLRIGVAVTSLALAFAAMLAKEMAVTAPALLAALAWGTGAWRDRRRHTLVLVGVHGLAALLFLLARTAVIGAFGHAALTPAGVFAGTTLAPVRLAAYFQIVLAPLGHHPGYVLPVPPLVVQLGAWVGLLAAAVLLRRAVPPLRVGLAWFALALLPVIGLVPLLADLADRFALLPSMGLAWAGAAAAAHLNRRWVRPAQIAAALLFVLYAAGTLTEGAAWADELTLWRKSTALEPQSGQAHRNLGVVLLRQGRAAEALVHFDRAAALGDDAVDLMRRRAMALDALGDGSRAEAAARAALTHLPPDSPRAGQLHALVGGLQVRRGRLPEADLSLARARISAPDAPATLMLEAELARAQGDLPAALAAESRLVTRYPREPRFRYRQGLALLLAGNPPGAAAASRQCLTLEPDQPQCLCLLGRSLAAAGTDPPAARRALDAALLALPAGEDRTACEQLRDHLR